VVPARTTGGLRAAAVAKKIEMRPVSTPVQAINSGLHRQ
jgi:hypothetical protein